MELELNTFKMKPIQEWKVKSIKMKFHKCLECPKAFLDIDELATHTKLHQEKHLAYALSAYVKLKRVKILGCDRCHRGFLSERLLLLHRLEHVNKSVNQDKYYNKNKEKPYKCPKCDNAFVAKSTLDAHSVIHEPFPHICYCGIGYYKQEDLRRHQKLVQCQKPKIKDTKPPNGFIKSEGEEEEKEEEETNSSPLKKKIKRAKVRNLKSSLESIRLPMPPLDVKFKKVGDRKYQCPECLKCYTEKQHAEKHYRGVHRRERPYPCHLCEKKFTQSGALKQHLKVHSGVKEHECQYCKRSFSNLGAKDLHERTHTGYKPYKCSYCPKTFSDPSAHKRHERIHTGDFKYRCEQCPMAFTDSSGLYAHRKRHKRLEREYACSKCDRKFYEKLHLNKHISVVHNKEYNFPCEICERKFSNSTNLMNHLNINHVPFRKTYPCDICGKVLLGKDYLNTHINNVHKKRKKYTCEFCDKKFSSPSTLNNHVTVHTKIKKYECDYCLIKMRLKSDMHKHILSRHIKIRCEMCSVYFASQSSLDQHKFEENKKCNYCESEFLCEKSLQKHLNVHLKEPKYFECDYCGQVFIKRLNIEKHLALHRRHQFKCEHCGDSFEFKERLRMHKLRHSDVRCKVCRRRFFSKFDFNKHKKKGCSSRKFGCSMCDRSFTTTRDLEKHEGRCQRGEREVGSREVKCPLCAKVFLSKHHAIAHLKVHKDDIKTFE